MQYMLMICGDESAMAHADAGVDEGLDPETTAWVEEMDARGVRKYGNRLRSTSTATTVRVRDGEVLVSDAASAYRQALELSRTDAERRYLTRRLAEARYRA